MSNFSIQKNFEEKKLAIKKMLELKQVGVLDMTFENKEECEGDFNAVFAAIETENEHYDEYRDEAIKISNSLLSLYTTSDGNTVELDPMAQQAMDVVLALKKIVLPIIHPSSGIANDKTPLRVLLMVLNLLP